MKKLLAIFVLAIAAYAGLAQHGPAPARGQAESAGNAAISANSDAVLAKAFQDHASKLPIEGKGTVSKILKDDTSGSKHQRFVVRLDSGQTLLIAHNIDLAPRIADLQQGDVLMFKGEYEWSAKGGVIHWTHRDPNGRHAAGWLKHGGKTYQ